MKNITIMKKTNMQKTTIGKITAKITTTALLFFFGIVFFDDMLSSPGIRTSKKAGLVCGGKSLFFGS